MTAAPKVTEAERRTAEALARIAGRRPRGVPAVETPVETPVDDDLVTEAPTAGAAPARRPPKRAPEPSGPPPELIRMANVAMTPDQRDALLLHPAVARREVTVAAIVRSLVDVWRLGELPPKVAAAVLDAARADTDRNRLRPGRSGA